MLGSNAFNLAAMVGFSALLTGAVTIERKPLIVEGFVGIAAMMVAVALVLGVLPAPVALALFVVVAAVYVVIV